MTKTKNGAGLLIFLGWLVYAFSYLGKVNYSANITQIIDFYDVTKAQAGMVPTFFFFAYGIGQVFNGIFCEKYNIKWVIFTSLIVSASINLAIAISTNFAVIKWLWLINGFTLSLLWPTIIRLLSESLPQKDLGKSSVVMGTTVAVGTLIIYGLSSIFVAFDKFKLSFFTASVAVFAVALIWMIFYNRAVKRAKAERKDELFKEAVKEANIKHEEQKSGEKKIFFISICVLCFCAVGVNLIKDGLTTWVPSILKEEFSIADSYSILLTLFLPVLAVFGNVCALRIHKKIPDYVSHCAITFIIIAAFTGIIIGSLTIQSIVLVLIGLIAANFFASSLNSLITSIFPMFMRAKINSGKFAGILNGFCYLGSTISSYGLGVIADNFGWTAVFYSLIAFCIAIVVVWIGYIILKKSFIKE